MARGIITLTSRGTGSLAEAVEWVVVPALAMYPDSSKMGASAIDEVQTAAILSKAKDHRKRPAASNKSVSKAIAEKAKRDGHQTGRARLSLWCVSSSVLPPSTPIDDLMLTEADKDSQLINERVRHAFGPLADNVVFDLTKSHIHMLYVEKHVQPLVIRVVGTDDPNADSKIDEALKTAEMIWMHVMAAKRRSALFEMNQRQNCPVHLLPALGNLQPWMIHVAHNAAALSARDNLSEEAACWLHDVDSRVITRWCDEFFEKHPGSSLRFEKYNRHLRSVSGNRFHWDKNAGRLDDFIMHINAKIRSTFESNPKGAPTFDAPLYVRECDPLDYRLFKTDFGEDTRQVVKMCADVPVIPGEKWMRIVRWVRDSATNKALPRELIFPSRHFKAALNLSLSDQNFRNFPGYIPVWMRAKAPQKKK